MRRTYRNVLENLAVHGLQLLETAPSWQAVLCLINWHPRAFCTTLQRAWGESGIKGGNMTVFVSTGVLCDADSLIWSAVLMLQAALGPDNEDPLPARRRRRKPAALRDDEDEADELEEEAHADDDDDVDDDDDGLNDRTGPM